MTETTLKNLVFGDNAFFIIDTILTVKQLNKVVKRMKKLKEQNISDNFDTEIIKDLITRKSNLKGYFEDLTHDPNYKEITNIPQVNY